MSEYPNGWFRDNQGSNEPTVDVPVRRPGSRPAAPPGSAWPQQPPARSYTGRGYAPARPAATYGGGGGRKGLRPRRVFGVLAIIVAVLLVAAVGEYFNLNGRLHHENVLADYAGRPAQGSGSNWLIAGSDSRQGLSAAQERALSTGQGIGGSRTDTIMLLHVPASGQPVLMSLPRDSYVPIPGHGSDKINAAFAIGGPALLAQTVQNVTGLRIDHFMEIGFGGFVGVVNAVGGVRMCLQFPLHDTASGLNLPKGCQVLSGAQALSYVRDRHDFAQQDLQRVQDQRLFMHALLTKMTSAGVILNPFAAIPAADGAAANLTVDSGTSLRNLVSVAFALRHPLTTTVPIASASFITPTGEDAVLWDRAKALALFRAMNAGTPIPPGLISGSAQQG